MIAYRTSRRWFLRTGVALASACVARRIDAADARDAIYPERLSEIETSLRTAVEAGDVPGIVALVATDRDMVYEGVFGARDHANGPGMTRDTVFQVASMVKVVTSVAAMQLVEQGKLRLNDPVPNIDPALGSPQVLVGFNTTGAPQLRPARGPITLRHLLTHTAGFSYRLWDADTARYLKVTNNRPAPPRTPLMFDPGERWEYGVNLDWVGRIVETVSGKRLDRYFRDHILGPLSLADTVFIQSPQQLARQASLHVRAPNGSLVAQPPEPKPAPKIYSGGGDIYSTAPDYLTLLQMLLQGGAHKGVRILKPETVALMGQNHIGDIEVGVLRTTMPKLSNDVDLFPGVSLRWGLGHMINMQPGPDGRSAGSLTWAGLYNTYYWIDPARRIAAVFMTQVLPFADQRTLRVYRQFERGIYNSLRPV
jgi:CubicO group peptidase (beta-lactamase class C family)